jgi:putative ABC transport system substrate-binding protein
MRRPAMWLMVVLAFSAVMVTAGNLRAANPEIAVMWVGKSGMTNRVLMGFMQRARTTAPDMTITLKRELKNMKDAETLFSQFESTMNGIVFLRSTGAKFLAKANPKVPCFIGGCNNPVYLGTIKNLNAPEGNITGVTYFIPYQEIFKLMLALFPNVKSVGILLEKGHPGAVIDQEGTREQCERFKLSYNEVVASNREQLVDGAKKLSGKVDIFIISNTALAMDNTVSLLPVANATKTPMFAFAEKPVKAGAVVGMVADDVKLGSMLADSVVDVVVKRKPISQVPVKTDPEPKVLINQAMMQSLELKFPQEILKKAEFVQ